MTVTAVHTEDASKTSLESALGVKGSLRVRSYGNVKHAHVVLRKVEEEEYEDSNGRKRVRGVFSLFAHKLINVKPGKELFLYLHPVNGELQEQSIAFEADLPLPGDNEQLKDGIIDYPQSSAPAQTLPPKMRKAWARKSFPVSPAIASETVDIARPPDPPKPSIGIQAQPSVNSVEIQVTTVNSDPEVDLRGDISLPKDVIGQTSKIETLLSEAGDPVPSNDLDVPTEDENCLANDSSTTETAVVTDYSREVTGRSLSPMDIESTTTTPEGSPIITVKQLYPEENFIIQETETITRSISPESEKEQVLASSPGGEEPVNVTSIPMELPPQELVASSSFSSLEMRQAMLEASSLPFLKPRLDNSEVASKPTITTVKVPDLPWSDIASAVLRLFGTASSSNFPSTTDDIMSIPGFGSHLSSEMKSPELVPDNKLTVQSDPLKSIRPKSPSVRSSSVYNATPSTSKVTLEQLSDRDASSSITMVSVDSNVSALLEKDAYGPQRQRTPDVGKRKRTSVSPSQVVVDEQSPKVKRWKPVSVEPTATVKLEPLSPVLRSNGSHLPKLPSSAPGSFSSTPTEVIAPSATQFDNKSRNDLPRRITEVIDLARDYSPSDWPAPKEHLRVKVEGGDPYPNGRVASFSGSPLTPDVSQTSYSASAYSATGWPIPAKPIQTTLPRRKSDTYRPSYRKALEILHSAQIWLKRDTGIRSIVFDLEGKHFAVVCRDSSVRIWDNITRTEIAKLAHSAPVVHVAWLDRPQPTITSLNSSGLISQWTLLNDNTWQWERLIDVGDADPSHFAYYKGRIAVANPRRGIKIWEFENGKWTAFDRAVPRKDVVVVKFMDDGASLLCGSGDGTLFCCSLPKCRVQPITNLKTKVFQIDIHPDGELALVAQASGRAHLINISTKGDERDLGRILQDYSLRDADRYIGRFNHAFGALFVNMGEMVVFGSVGGCALVWDRRRGGIIHEMEHKGDGLIQAVAAFDGKDGVRCLISATSKGDIHWWDLPSIDDD